MPVRCYLVVLVLLLPISMSARAAEPPTVRLDAGHPWRPPFELDRVGKPLGAVVEFPDGARPVGMFSLSIRRKGEELGRRDLKVSEQPPFLARSTIEPSADELVVLVTRDAVAKPVEVARQTVAIPEVEAEAVAKADRLINPIDLGTVLVPSGWLLLGPGQGGSIDLAAISRTRDREMEVIAWYESSPPDITHVSLALPKGSRTNIRLMLPATPPAGERDILRIVLADADGSELWRKAIPVMIVRDPPKLPAFGATALKLRFDAPISVRDPEDGRLLEHEVRGRLGREV